MVEISLSSTEDRGQVGIGTLIVFIAMVLVAAIAAGVLINTADLLQSQAQDTSDQSSQQVTDRVEVTDPIGFNETAGQNLSSVNMTFSKAPGSGDINLSNVVVSWEGSGETATFALNTSKANYSNVITISSIKDPDDSIDNTLLNSKTDRARVKINMSKSTNSFNDQFPALPTLEGGDEVSLRISTAAGGTTSVELSVKPSLVNEDSVAL